MCSRSLNGGLTWEPGTPVYENPGPQEDNLCGAQHGHLGAAPDGTVYLPTPLCGFRPTVFVSRDDGLTWERSQVADVNIPLSDPDVAVDRDGNVYVASIDESGALFMAASQDEGRTWVEHVLLRPFGAGRHGGRIPRRSVRDHGRLLRRRAQELSRVWPLDHLCRPGGGESRVPDRAPLGGGLRGRLRDRLQRLTATCSQRGESGGLRDSPIAE